MWSPPDKPGTLVLIYDGRCAFCERNSDRLMRRVPRDRVVRVSYHEPGVLESYPSLTREQCDRAMQLVLADGRIVAGAQAAAEAFKSRPRTGWVANAYYVPGARWLCDHVYAWIARRRYRFAGRTGACESGACAVDDTRGG